MAAVDLHPDIVQAINQFAQTKLGKRYGRWAKERYGVGGKKLAAKTVAGEFGGRSTKSGRGVVSSAGARGPAQFIPTTRDAYKQRYGVDPWKDDASAIKGIALHQMNTGVEGYNPGMPTYKDYILGQRINPEDIAALRQGGVGRIPTRRPTTKVSSSKYTIPGESLAPERREARRALLLGGDINMRSLLAYKQQIAKLKDEPSQTVTGPMQITRTKAKAPASKGVSKGGPAAPRGKYAGGKIYEAFYDPAGVYYDSGKLVKGAIGGHPNHVHVGADNGYVVQLGKLAQSMGLSVGEQRRFGGTPTGGHTDGSFHYEDKAIDVSGDPKKLAAFYRRVLRAAKAQR